jgi:hypothetical protein
MYGIRGAWKQLHNENLHNVYASSYITRLIKRTEIKWTGHLALIWRRGKHAGFSWESQKEGDH